MQTHSSKLGLRLGGSTRYFAFNTWSFTRQCASRSRASKVRRMIEGWNSLLWKGWFFLTRLLLDQGLGFEGIGYATFQQTRPFTYWITCSNLHVVVTNCFSPANAVATFQPCLVRCWWKSWKQCRQWHCCGRHPSRRRQRLKPWIEKNVTFCNSLL